MSTPQLVAVVAVVALVSAGLGVVITSRRAPEEVTIKLDLGGEKSLNLNEFFTGDLETARPVGNENAAIATLRSLSSAQAQMQAMAAIDTDADGGGEFGYLAELAGSAPLRGLDDERLNPPVLSSAFGIVSDSGTVERNGYFYRVYLPGPTVDDETPGLAEGPGGGCALDGPLPDSDNAEILWCAYAWPTDAGTTGQRSFFVNHEGDILETANVERVYEGEDAPVFDAALSTESPGDMLAPLAIMGATANDGRTWSRVGY